MQQKHIGLLVIIGITALLFGASTVSAQISLGTSQSFSVLGGSGVTNTGPSALSGNVGVFPGTSVTGFPPGIVTGGTIHAGDATAGQAQTDLTTAYNAVAGTACNVDLTGQDLGGLTLTPGVYCFSSSAFLTGTLTLNMQGNANALFLFKIGSTLITASGSSVVLINSGNTICPPNVYWQVGSSATLGTGSTFAGNILALTSISLTTGARLNGRALARNGAVTLDNNTVVICQPAIVCPVITVAPPTLPNGEVGIAYLATVSASGGVGPYTFAVTSGALPTGLTLDGATGDITGTPTTIGTFNFTITATDGSSGCFGSRAYTVVIAAAGCPVITLSPPTLVLGAVGMPYSATISATVTAPPTTFAVTSGALPPGLTLNAATGAITGTPTAAGLFNFTVQSTDANLCTGSGPYSILIAAAPSGVPAVGFIGLSILVMLLAGAGLFFMNRFSI
ncbi:MAG: ice-binding family protein [Thermoanaerobaculia bacterium]